MELIIGGYDVYILYIFRYECRLEYFRVRIKLNCDLIIFKNKCKLDEILRNYIYNL